ncbi:MAG: hypothetical protein MR434_08690 [Ruminococcus sp.]|nr:hypothetical protein [Ruminococcus sp.]
MLRLWLKEKELMRKRNKRSKLIEISNFEQGLITAIENIKDNPTKGNVKALKSFFNKSFNSNQATLFEIFSGDRLTYEQQKILFDSIEVRQKCNIYNAISVESRERYLAYLVYTENNEYTVEGFNKFLNPQNSPQKTSTQPEVSF